jgi:predicted metalloprotease with PDZ domain
MKKLLFLCIILCLFYCKEDSKDSQKTISKTPENNKVSSTYQISFDNAVHHEAQVQVTFSNLKEAEAEFRMSRTSPGRYALHEFMKNVYDVKVTDANGNPLEFTRPNPYSWKVKNHKGIINVQYTLFANRGGGTYAQIDETHAHLNIPATFMYAPELADAPMEVTFNVREDLGWKVATQLKPINGTTYHAKDLQYFMDSPTEISNHSVRTFQVDGQNIHFVLHHNGTEAELDTYFEKVKKVVLEQKEVYGELPKFDYGNYYFLACYIPNASGDGMEHRNSTILTTTRSLSGEGMERNIGTVSHEFFHAWNVERIRPKSLEPFDFEEANMSGELWFAEGFTSYYTNLMLCRADLISKENYIKGLSGTFNYVWNSPGRQFFNPIEMSYQAPFVDAAKSVDPVNRNNTFISYYSYGSALGLALDLSLRQHDLNLDDYMKLVWNKYGKNEKPYTISDLHNTLKEFAGDAFGDAFFNNYIYKSGMPDMKGLFESVGVALTQNPDAVLFGADLNRNNVISENTKMGSSAYNAGLEKGDKIIQIGSYVLNDDIETVLKHFKPKDEVKVIYERYGNKIETKLTFISNPSYTIKINSEASNTQKTKRDNWLATKL